MYPFERKKEILNKLRSVGRITINEDAILLGISSATLHRDLKTLEEEGLVKKVVGGAILAEASQVETHFDIRMKTKVKEKEEIARKASEAVKDDTSIFLDQSSSALFLARELKRRHFHNLILITNSLVIPFELVGKRGVQIILTGGVVESEFRALSGRQVVESVQHFNLDQIFASAGAISAEQGLMTQIPFIQELLPKIFLCGRLINILVDSSKFFKTATYRIAPIDSSLRIFTDIGLPKSLRAKVEKRGAKVIV